MVRHPRDFAQVLNNALRAHCDGLFLNATFVRPENLQVYFGNADVTIAGDESLRRIFLSNIIINKTKKQKPPYQIDADLSVSNAESYLFRIIIQGSAKPTSIQMKNLLGHPISSKVGIPEYGFHPPQYSALREVSEATYIVELDGTLTVNVARDENTKTDIVMFERR